MSAQHAADRGILPLREIEGLRGPRGLPVFGNALQVRRDQIQQQVESWCAHYGDHFRIRFGKRRFLVLADPDTVASAMGGGRASSAALPRWRS